MKIKIFILIGLVLSFSSINFAQVQKIQKCSVVKGIGGKYKLVNESRPLGTFKEVLLHVVIKPANFNQDYLTEFAKRIKAEYCNEETVTVNIFDNRKAVDWLYDYVNTGGKVDKRRGTYLLSRKTDKETIEFSTKPDNPINEVRIELFKPKIEEKW